MSSTVYSYDVAILRKPQVEPALDHALLERVRVQAHNGIEALQKALVVTGAFNAFDPIRRCEVLDEILEHADAVRVVDGKYGALCPAIVTHDTHELRRAKRPEAA